MSSFLQTISRSSHWRIWNFPHLSHSLHQQTWCLHWSEGRLNPALLILVSNVENHESCSSRTPSSPRKSPSSSSPTDQGAFPTSHFQPSQVLDDYRTQAQALPALLGGSATSLLSVPTKTSHRHAFAPPGPSSFLLEYAGTQPAIVLGSSECQGEEANEEENEHLLPYYVSNINYFI